MPDKKAPANREARIERRMPDQEELQVGQQPFPFNSAEHDPHTMGCAVVHQGNPRFVAG
jgi:hypothetical protein